MNTAPNGSKPKSLKEIFEQEIFSNQSSALKASVFQGANQTRGDFTLTSPDLRVNNNFSDLKCSQQIDEDNQRYQNQNSLKQQQFGMSIFKSNTDNQEAVNQFMQSLLNPMQNSSQLQKSSIIQNKDQKQRDDSRKNKHTIYQEIFGDDYENSLLKAMNEEPEDEFMGSHNTGKKSRYDKGQGFGESRYKQTFDKAKKDYQVKAAESQNGQNSMRQKSQISQKQFDYSQRESRWQNQANKNALTIKTQQQSLSSSSRSRKSSKDSKKVSFKDNGHVNDSLNDMDCQTYYQSIQGLLQEKEKIEQEEIKITKNKNLNFLDKCGAMKSARSLSRTINSLIGKQTEKMSEYYDSQLREQSHIQQSLQSQRDNLQMLNLKHVNGRDQFSNTLQYESSNSNNIREFDELQQRHLNSLDVKNSQFNYNERLQNPVDESMCSFQSRAYDDPDIYANELQQFSRNDSQQSNANPLQKSQLHNASSQNQDKRYSNQNKNDLNNTPSFDPFALANSTLGLQSLKNFSLGASQQLQFLQSKQINLEKLTDIEIQFQEQLTRYNEVLDQYELVTQENSRLEQENQTVVHRLQDLQKDRDRVNSENLQLLEKINEYKYRCDKSVDTASSQELQRKYQILNEEKKLLNDKLSRFEVEKDQAIAQVLDQKASDFKFVQDQFEVQIKSLQDQLSQKDQQLSLLQQQFDQFDEKLDMFNDQAVKMEALQKSAEVSQKQQVELLNTVKYLEGLLDGQQQVQSEFQSSIDLQRVVSELRNDLKAKNQDIKTTQEKCDEYKDIIDKLTLEKQSLNDRLDSVINVTQKDRVDSNLQRLEIDTYMKQIDHLKLSELNLKKQVNKLKQQLQSQYKDQAENNDKYAKELEQNKSLNFELKAHQSKLEEYEMQNSQLNSRVEESELSIKAMNAKIEKQKSKLCNKVAVIEDLKESVNLKITVTEDLQNLLQQSQSQYNEIKRELKNIAKEKDKLLGKFYKVENINSQLHSMNKQLFGEIDNLQSSIVQMTNSGMNNPGTLTTFNNLNPFLSHLSQLKSIYEQKFSHRDVNLETDEELQQIFPSKQKRKVQKTQNLAEEKQVRQKVQQKQQLLDKENRNSFNDTELQKAINFNKHEEPTKERRISNINSNNVNDSINMRDTTYSFNQQNQVQNYNLQVQKLQQKESNNKIFADQKMSLLSLDSRSDQNTIRNNRYTNNSDQSQSMKNTLNKDLLDDINNRDKQYFANNSNNKYAEVEVEIQRHNQSDDDSQVEYSEDDSQSLGINSSMQSLPKQHRVTEDRVQPTKNLNIDNVDVSTHNCISFLVSFCYLSFQYYFIEC
eukprot:403350441